MSRNVAFGLMGFALARTRVLRLTSGLAPSALAMLLVARPLMGQEPINDRRTWIKPTTQTTDDPRRIVVQPGPTGPDGSIVLRGGLIFDGTGAPARPGTLVIERNRISKVLPAGATDFPSGARVIDVAGTTVMPGLIDLHTHLSYSAGSGGDEPAELMMDPVEGTLRGVERLRFFIESGITTVRDVGSHGIVPYRLKSWVRQRRVPGPRVFAAGMPITAKGGHGAEGMWVGYQLNGMIREASGPDDWREAVREQFFRGADLIKIASNFSKAEVQAAVDEAHNLGLKITCDCETLYTQWAAEAGVDGIEHPLPRTDEAIRIMAAKGVAAVPTVVVYSIIFDLRGGYWGASSRRFDFSKGENVEMVRRLKNAGVKMGIGTDLVGSWFRYMPNAYIRELKLFVEAGYTLPEVLVAATKTSAEILDMDDKLGTLQAGKLADVLVVKGRPDQNLDDLTKIQFVIRDGEVVVQGGRVVVEPHVPWPEPTPQKTGPPRPGSQP